MYFKLFSSLSENMQYIGKIKSFSLEKKREKKNESLMKNDRVEERFYINRLIYFPVAEAIFRLKNYEKELFEYDKIEVKKEKKYKLKPNNIFKYMKG